MNSAYKKFARNRVVLERMEVVGPMEKSKSAMNALFDDGWRLIRTGPYTDRKLHPNVDSTRFLFIAEREVSAPSSH